MRQVFVSHKLNDPDLTPDFIPALKSCMEGVGCVPWFATEELLAGDQWVPEIDRALRRSVGTVVLLTPSSSSSPYVAYEWSHAFGQQIPVLPLLVANAAIHRRLQDVHYEDFRNGARPWNRVGMALRKWVSMLDALQLKVPESYQFAALRQVLDSLRANEHKRISAIELNRLIGDLRLRDGVNPMYEPLNLRRIEQGLQIAIAQDELSMDGDFFNIL